MNAPAQLGGRSSFAARVARIAVMAMPLLVAACGDKAPPAATTFRVRFETSAGNFVVQVNREWAPLGAERFHQLVTEGYFTDARFFRVVPGFITQFGMHADPAVNSKWADAKIQDDPVVQSNLRGRLTFASAAPTPNTRSNQLFINLANNGNLDAMGFSPIGEVIEGMDVVDQLHDSYGEAPDQVEIRARGNAYLQQAFPKLDYIKSATIIPG